MHYEITRENWEQNQRASYWEAASESIRKRPLSDWLSPTEIAEAMTGIRERWKECGRQMRRTMDVQQRCNLEYERRELNEYLREIRDNKVPIGPYYKQLTYRLRESIEKAIEEENERRWKEDNPINDEAWTGYLRWLEDSCSKRGHTFEVR